jgi:HAMP domain-containing protein
MTIESRRDKLVTFRVSADEYHSLSTACVAGRLRSISELARAAIQQWINESSPANPFDTELQHVERRIQAMAQELERLRCLVQLQKSARADKSPAQAG